MEGSFLAETENHPFSTRSKRRGPETELATFKFVEARAVAASGINNDLVNVNCRNIP